MVEQDYSSFQWIIDVISHLHAPTEIYVSLVVNLKDDYVCIY